MRELVSMAFNSVGDLADAFKSHGVTELLIKTLSANDGSRHGIYVAGKGFDKPAVEALPHGSVESETRDGEEYLTAPLALEWLADDGTTTLDRDAMLRRVKPKKDPEVRITFSLSNVPQPVRELLGSRLKASHPTGRVLVIGTGTSDRVMAWLCGPENPLAEGLKRLAESSDAPKVSEIFTRVPIEDIQRGGRCWSLLMIAGKRHHQGNRGYADVAEASYHWDSTVVNHARLSQGDTVVVRDAQTVLGIAVIESLAVSPNQTKDRLRCPECSSTKLKHRTATSPPYRCGKCKATFADPEVESINVTAYEAHYRSSWRSFEDEIAIDRLKAITRGSDRASIRRVEKAGLDEMLEEAGWIGRPWELFAPSTRPGSASASPTGGIKTGKGRWRVGQAAFRDRLLARDGAVCAITGPQPKAILDAAHWVPFAETHSHKLGHGLLLRKDIHRLVDHNDITICPEDWTVAVNPRLEDYPDIWKLERAPISVDPSVLDRLVISEHWRLSTASWARSSQ